MAHIHHYKYIEAILYILAECDNRHMGAVKLMKMLYYLDFDHCERYQTSVTGDIYIKMQLGPVPQYAQSQIAWMRSLRILDYEPPAPGTRERHNYVPRRQSDLSVFTPTERTILEAVCLRWKHADTNTIVRASHEEAPWLSAINIGDVVSYDLAAERKSFPDALSADQKPYPGPMSAELREAIIQSVVASQKLEGVEIPRSVVERKLSEALNRPLIEIL